MSQCDTSRSSKNKQLSIIMNGDEISGGKSSGDEISGRKSSGDKISGDRISSLSDPLLHKVLYLMNARQMVQTCVLSKRWLKLWTFAQSITFDLADFVDPIDEDVTPDVIRKFTKFVNCFLNLRDVDSDVHTFRLICPGIRPWDSYAYDELRILPPSRQICELIKKKYLATCAETAASATNWVLYAVEHKPKILQIQYSGDYSFNIPDYLFACTSLEEVKVAFPEGAYKIVEPKEISFPKLRTLEFSHASFFDNNLEILLCDCPALENLSLRTCIVGNFCSHTVKQLLLSGCITDKITISAPRVELLELNIDMGMELTLKHASKVSRALFTATGPHDSYNCDLLSTMSGVEALVIDTTSLQKFWEREAQQCPTFGRLNSLTLGDCCMLCAFDTMSSLLHHCPQLEELTLLHSQAYCKVGGNHSTNIDDYSVQKIPWEELATVDIKYYGWGLWNNILHRLIYKTYDNYYIDIEFSEHNSRGN